MGAAGFIEGSHKTFGIFDVKTKSYTKVTGLPNTDIINDIALAYAVGTTTTLLRSKWRPPIADCPLYTPSVRMGKRNAVRRSIRKRLKA